MSGLIWWTEQRDLRQGWPHTKQGDEAMVCLLGRVMDLSELSDDELLSEVKRAQGLLADAERYLDDVLVEGSRRKTLTNAKIAAHAGIHERSFYKAMDRAWKRANT